MPARVSPAKGADGAHDGVGRDLGDEALRHHPADAGVGCDETACTSHALVDGSIHEATAAGVWSRLVLL